MKTVERRKELSGRLTNLADAHTQSSSSSEHIDNGDTGFCQLITLLRVVTCEREHKWTQTDLCYCVSCSGDVTRHLFDQSKATALWASTREYLELDLVLFTDGDLYTKWMKVIENESTTQDKGYKFNYVSLSSCSGKALTAKQENVQILWLWTIKPNSYKELHQKKKHC